MGKGVAALATERAREEALAEPGRGRGLVRSAALSGPEAHLSVLAALLVLPLARKSAPPGNLWRVCSPGEFPATR